MGMTEKQSLINQLTVKLVEDYSLNLKEVKSKIQDILQQYHVTIADEYGDIENYSTSFLLQKFFDGKKSSGMSEESLRQYKIAVQKLEEYTGKELANIESEDINNFLLRYGQKVSSVTLRGKYQLLSSVYNYLFVHRYVLHNPISSVDVPKMTVKYKNPMSDYDLEKMKYICESMQKNESIRDMALIYFFVSTGCRVSEVAKVKIKDIDFESKTCVVMGKGRKQRPVVLSDKAIYRIKLYLETRNYNEDSPLFCNLRVKDRHLSKESIEKIIKKITQKAGIDSVTCHSLRRYYATELRKRNVSVQMIASSLGHANLNQINRYSVYNTNDMLNVIRTSI